MCLDDEKFCRVGVFLKFIHSFNSTTFAYGKLGFETPRDSSGQFEVI